MTFEKAFDRITIDGVDPWEDLHIYLDWMGGTGKPLGPIKIFVKKNWLHIHYTVYFGL